MAHPPSKNNIVTARYYSNAIRRHSLEDIQKTASSIRSPIRFRRSERRFNCAGRFWRWFGRAMAKASGRPTTGRPEPALDRQSPSLHHSASHSPANNRDSMSALPMTGFIHRHFPERITLAGIAAAGALRIHVTYNDRYGCAISQADLAEAGKATILCLAEFPRQRIC